MMITHENPSVHAQPDKTYSIWQCLSLFVMGGRAAPTYSIWTHPALVSYCPRSEQVVMMTCHHFRCQPQILQRWKLH